MANLIITVISIALVAVAALMGAYYGGSAFMDGQKKAEANKMINVMQQTEGAYNLCIAQEPNGQSPDGPCQLSDSGNGTLESKKYLSSDPIAQLGYSNYEHNYGPTDTGPEGWGPGFYISLDGDTSDHKQKNNVELCRKIAQIAGGNNAVPRLMSAFPFPGSSPVYKMDCVYTDTNGDSVMSDTDQVIIYYKF
jgi:hypothetical protein